MESSAFTTATSETSIRSVTQPSGSIVARNWVPSRTPNSQVRTFLFSGAWTSTGKPGELITYSQPTTLNGPIPLPHVLITGSSTSGYSIDNPSGTNPTMSGMTHFGLQYCSNGLYRTGYKVFVSINGTQFHSGSLFVVAVPQPHILYKQLGNQYLRNNPAKFKEAFVKDEQGRMCLTVDPKTI